MSQIYQALILALLNFLFTPAKPEARLLFRGAGLL